jgi:hypothetical protein
MRCRRLIVVLALACLTTPAAAEAQFGNILKDQVKKRAKDAVEKKAGGTADTASATPAPRAGAKAAAPTPATVYHVGVVELTEDVMARLTSAYEVAARTRDSLRAVATDEERWQREHQACMMDVVRNDPKYTELSDATQKGSQQEQSRAVQTVGQYVLTKCGDGNQADRAKSALDTMPAARVVRLSGLNRNEVSIARERLEPFCAAPPAEPASGFAQIPGQDGHFFVYSVAEVKAIRPRCAVLTGLFARL